ncbi:hypothetical protein [Candidatus Frankia nodulisporulans]|uniref:hypothetical protein n=1 Tax=Candidatus Frankia nodulisporulans TaxID=2060052 RepID=UPI0013D86DBD|nr:hypothetical protein [Candidatus Frankia nodulisporulans]
MNGATARRSRALRTATMLRATSSNAASNPWPPGWSADWPARSASGTDAVDPAASPSVRVAGTPAVSSRGCGLRSPAVDSSVSLALTPSGTEAAPDRPAACGGAASRSRASRVAWPPGMLRVGAPPN